MTFALAVVLIAWAVCIGGIIASVYYPTVQILLAIFGSMSVGIAVGGILFMVITEWREDT